MKYIGDKILLIIEYFKKKIKTKVVGGFLDEFLKVKNIYIHPLNLGPYINLKFWFGIF